MVYKHCDCPVCVRAREDVRVMLATDPSAFESVYPDEERRFAEGIPLPEATVSTRMDDEWGIAMAPHSTTYHDPFDDILKEMSALHTKKGSDYGTGADPYANIRASADFGIPAWLGAIMRMNDKITRIKSFIAKGNLENESLLDSLKDIPVYGVIAQLLYLEENPQ